MSLRSLFARLSAQVARAISTFSLAFAVAIFAASPAWAAKVVRVDTSLGAFEIELFEDTAPLHVENFVDNYVETGDYDGSIIHRRALPSTGVDVIQGGGFTFDLATNTIGNVPNHGTVDNEFTASRSNVKYTVALARPPGSIDGGSNQWFINTGNNAAALDPQSFTVFGKVISGTDVVDAIAALPVFAANIFHPAFNELPLRNGGVHAASGLPGLGQDLVFINSMTLLDSDALPAPEPGAVILGLVAFGAFMAVAVRAQS